MVRILFIRRTLCPQYAARLSTRSSVGVTRANRPNLLHGSPCRSLDRYWYARLRGVLGATPRAVQRRRPTIGRVRGERTHICRVALGRRWRFQREARPYLALSRSMLPQRLASAPFGDTKRCLSVKHVGRTKLRAESLRRRLHQNEL